MRIIAKPTKRRKHPVKINLEPEQIRRVKERIAPSGISLSAHVATLLDEDLRRRALEEEAARSGGRAA